MTDTRTVDLWAPARRDLEVTILGPISIALSEDHVIEAEMLVEGFGAPNGMIVVHDAANLGNWEHVAAAGYGYSVFGAPGENEQYDRAVVMDVLLDWGWAGPAEDAPEWCRRRQQKRPASKSSPAT